MVMCLLGDVDSSERKAALLQVFLMKSGAVRGSEDLDRQLPASRAQRGFGHSLNGHPVFAPEPGRGAHVPGEPLPGDGEPGKLLQRLLGMVVEIVRSTFGIQAQEVALDELALIYEAKGLPRAQAEQVAERLMADEQGALDAMVREELGLDPSTLGGSPYSAGGSSFVLFAVGAIIPLIPFFFVSGIAAVVAAILSAGLGLFLIGALISLLTGRGAVFSGLRQLVFGLLAAGMTFGLGRLIGSALS